MPFLGVVKGRLTDRFDVAFFVAVFTLLGGDFALGFEFAFFLTEVFFVVLEDCLPGFERWGG